MHGEVHFNDAHGKTQMPVEWDFGLLKARLRCLDKTGGAFLYSTDRVCQITVACCMLQNITLQQDIPIITEDGDREEPLGEDLEMPNEDDSGKEKGPVVCQDVIDRFFT
ncbi:hypothetical protein NDU88_009827 [Pleurodeles waltl]|uniref:DDE Tnp4 domain-containing protein n=1 Tax=Pleurodeles waltl TaxID=8319 RepID=A0AAV7RZF0_PLEWA|nr:hypothetical protein NDU88_009827 [Pleurodeles waltl]